MKPPSNVGPPPTAPTVEESGDPHQPDSDLQQPTTDAAGMASTRHAGRAHPSHPGQPVEVFLPDGPDLGPAINRMIEAFDLADALGLESAWRFRQWVIARLRSDRPELLAPELTFWIARGPKGGARD